MEEIVQMSTKELERLRILQKTVEKQLTQNQAAQILELSERQMRKFLMPNLLHNEAFSAPLSGNCGIS